MWAKSNSGQKFKCTFLFNSVKQYPNINNVLVT